MLFERVEPGLGTLQSTRDHVRNEQGHLNGHIRITAPADFPTGVLANDIAAFRRDYPAVFFDLMLTNSALNLVGDNIDIALRVEDREGLDRVEHKLTDVTWRFYASAQWIDGNGVPSRLEDLQGFIAPSEELRAFLERFMLAEGVLPEATITADNHFFIRDLVIAGVGGGLLPVGICENVVSEGILLPVLDGTTSRATQPNITFPSRSDITQRVRSFADVLAAQMRQAHADWGE